jgi:tetratricopeptide (TPR) repeat protein
MNFNRRATWIAALLLVALLAGSVAARQRVEQLRGNQSTLEEVLYLPSGKTVKRLSLGYSSLLADIYWTRAVQYFGARHIQHEERYDLLAPLLDITTDLDPHLLVAYQNGAIFLSQHQPDGAGEPDKAVALVEKGIRNNPTYWRLYFTLGFIHYMDRHDYKAAQQAFEKGSEVPGALSWMKVMAARMAEKADDPSTAGYLWKTIYETTTDKDIKHTAVLHLQSLQAEAEIAELERRTMTYEQRFGKLPESWMDLIRAGLLRGIPEDPTGTPYRLRLDGTVQVEDPKKLPYVEHHARGQNK